jgi:tetratricopeptide (TPR) repeat protein
VIAGKVAGARDQKDEILLHLQNAVHLEDQMPYMEPPYWYSSARQSLGAALLKAGKSPEAEQIFREELKKLPNNGWPLFGLAQSLRAQGKMTDASETEKQLEEAWKYADVKLDLAWF